MTMQYDKLREHRRRERAHYETERMLRRYPYECSPCERRALTAEELQKLRTPEKGRR